MMPTNDGWEQKAAADEEESEELVKDAESSTGESQTPAAELSISDEEAGALLSIATARTNATRKYLIEDVGIKDERVGQCRVTYSLKDNKPPRVEVRF